MRGLNQDAAPGLSSKRIRCSDQIEYPERVLHIPYQCIHTHSSHSLRDHLSFSFPSPCDRIHFLRAWAFCEDRAIAEHGIRGRNQFELMHGWNREEFFSVPVPLCFALCLHTPKRWCDGDHDPCQLCVSTPVAFAYYSHHHLLDSDTIQQF